MNKKLSLILLLLAVFIVPLSSRAEFTIRTTCDDSGNCKTFLEKYSPDNYPRYPVKNLNLYNKLRGRIIMLPERAGEAYYVDATSLAIYPLGAFANGLKVLQAHGEGISNANIAKIPVGVLRMYGPDKDYDGLSNAIEEALGTNINNFNTDGDVYSDYWEVTHGFDPLGPGRYPINTSYVNKQLGRILIQTQRHGEAWYVNPGDGKRYYLGSKYDANDIISKLSVGLSSRDYNGLTGQ